MTANIMTIAGSDSGGGAGIQADLKTILALGAYGTTAITALTAQNGLTVAGIHAAPPEFVELQINTILAGFRIAAAKTGMLFSAPIIKAVARVLAGRNFPLVVDPVSISQSGCQLLDPDAITALCAEILPGCDLLTPNAPEAECLTGIKITSAAEAFQAAEKLAAMGAKAVLVKGGHLKSSVMVTDYLYIPGQKPKELPQARVETDNTHGTGCTLSAAIATLLGQGLPLEIAVIKAQRYLNEALRKSWNPGQGHGPVNHAACLVSKS